jgi:hypothetical protein
MVNIVANIGGVLRYSSFFDISNSDIEVPDIGNSDIGVIPVVSYREQKNMVNRKLKVLKFCLILLEQKNQTLNPEILSPRRDSNPEPLPSNRHALPLNHQAK